MGLNSLSLGFNLGRRNRGSVDGAAVLEVADHFYVASDVTPGTVSTWTDRNAAAGATIGLNTGTDAYDTTFDGDKMTSSTGFVSLPYAPTFTSTTGSFGFLACFAAGGAWTGRLLSAESASTNGLLVYAGTSPALTVTVGGSVEPDVSVSANVDVSGAPNVAGVFVTDGVMRLYTSENGWSAPAAISSVGAITWPAAARLFGRAYTTSAFFNGSLWSYADWGTPPSDAEVAAASATMIGMAA